MPKKHVESTPQPLSAEPESLAQLRGDCARMASHWSAAPAAPHPHEPVSPSRIHGIEVPPTSAHLLDGMSEYGD
ncbi:hypothetical protein ABZW18_02380 [Streptomyces sp. NPDC004647]|uniref:hypothetical protein n=1 Tax=Streptomyces sp. NPDC004647 TaxID=3154671 RepID=UPI0033BF0E30